MGMAASNFVFFFQLICHYVEISLWGLLMNEKLLNLNVFKSLHNYTRVHKTRLETSSLAMIMADQLCYSY